MDKENVEMGFCGPDLLEIFSTGVDRRLRLKNSARADAGGPRAVVFRTGEGPRTYHSSRTAGVGAERGGWGRRGGAHTILRGPC
jgi:hypothetical protein